MCIRDRTSITENREVLWFAALAFGALLSPPDPLSLFLVGGPVLVLLEVALVIDRLTNRGGCLDSLRPQP